LYALCVRIQHPPNQAVKNCHFDIILKAPFGIATVTIGSSSGSAQIDSVGPGLYSMNGEGTGVAAAGAA
jgi:hypothetical protein